METATANIARTDPTIGGAIAQLDYMRRSPFAVGGTGQHKEWQHFVIFAPEVDLLVNFNLCDDVRPNAAVGAEFPRIVLLVRERGWDGDVDTFAMDRVHVRGARIDLAFADNRLRFEDGAYTISVALAERPISLDLRLVPTVMPASVVNLPMLDGPPLHWVVAPRLEVTGHLNVDGRVHAFDRVPAYHDHNWGHFLWGHDISWEWGFVLPRDRSVPWCATFVRLTNRARSVALAQSVLLWRRERLTGMFREDEVTVQRDRAHLRAAQVFKVPRVMALVAPETTSDVPRAIEFRGARGDDWVECRCVTEDLAQVLIPAETRLGVTVFNEVLANSTVRGQLAGEAVEFEGRSILEFIREY